MSVQIDMYGALLQSEQARKDDRDQLMKELERVKASSAAVSTYSQMIFSATRSPVFL